MLTQSVLNLNIERKEIEDFKIQATKILTGMLGSRLNLNEFNPKINKPLTDANNIDQIKQLNDNNDINVIDKLKMMRFENELVNCQFENNQNAIVRSSPIVNLPPPPTLAELNEYSQDTITMKQLTIDTNYDENDNPNGTAIIENEIKDENIDHSNIKTIDGFSAKISPVQQHHCSQQYVKQYNTNGHENNVIYRNKNTKPELTTHACDRRSYIEKDNINQNRFPNHNNNSITSHTTEIASELRDGKHPVCSVCNITITRGPFITALGRIWCPEHFVCVNVSCRRPLQDIGFVEEKGDLYCEYCFEKFLAPPCAKCSGKIKGDCLNAIGKPWHPECFNCTSCQKLFGNSPFFLEEGCPYCQHCWNDLFTTKCFACGFPVEAGDRWVEALSHNYHSQCFNCTVCKKNLEGAQFYAKAGRPFCKNHAR